MTNADTARKVVFELFQDLDGFNLGDYKQCTDDGQNMNRLIDFIANQAEYSGYQFKNTGNGMYELVRQNGDILQFTREREKALSSENLQLFGLEHPVVVQMLKDAETIPPFSRALICSAPDPAKQGFLVVWKVDVQSATGKNDIYIIRIGMSPAGERLTALEG